MTLKWGRWNALHQWPIQPPSSYQGESQFITSKNSDLRLRCLKRAGKNEVEWTRKEEIRKAESGTGKSVFWRTLGTQREPLIALISQQKGYKFLHLQCSTAEILAADCAYFINLTRHLQECWKSTPCKRFQLLVTSEWQLLWKSVDCVFYAWHKPTKTPIRTPNKENMARLKGDWCTPLLAAWLNASHTQYWHRESQTYETLTVVSGHYSCV